MFKIVKEYYQVLARETVYEAADEGIAQALLPVIRASEFQKVNLETDSRDFRVVIVEE